MAITDFKNANALGVPTIGMPTLIAAVNVVTLKCPCKNIIMGQMGVPIPCSDCKKVWFVSATVKIQIQEVLADLGDSNKQLSLTGN